MGKFCGNCFNNTLNEQNICTLCGFDGGYNRQLAPHALPAGAILNGRYIIGRILGQGGFGITYTARNHQTGELVAVKEFYPDSMVTRTDLTEVTPFLGERGENFAYGKETFLQEAETMAQFIGNPNIVRVYSYFEENGTAYFVMEYVDGVSYLDYLKQKGGKIGFDDALKILLPVMDALSVVHEKNIIHRDVTPDNIYISKDGTVKLLDFGAARYSLGNASRSLDVILKHGFAPREQYKRRGRQGPFTDVYSLGATLYYSVTGIRPDDALERVDEDLVALPSTLGITISREQESALMKAMAVDPENRFQSMAEFRHALTQAKPAAKPAKTAEKRPEPEKQKPVPAKKSKQEKKIRLLIPAAAALVCICIIASIFVFGRKSDSPALSSEPTQAHETQHTVPTVTPDNIPETVPLSPEAIAYNEAVDLFYQGEYGKAAIAFGKLRDFRDAKEISFKIWDAIAKQDSIAFGWHHTIGLKSDGTVVSVGEFADGRADVETWTDVVAVSAMCQNSIALHKDGTVSEIGSYSSNIRDWKDIVQIDYSDNCTVGLKLDGTIVVKGNRYASKDDLAEYAKWTDIVAFYDSFGLKADGTVVHLKSDNYDLSSWSDMIDLCYGNSHIIGLKENGTVIMECMHSLKAPCNCDVSGWTDIISVSAGAKHILGLKSDGTVVATGSNSNKQCEVADWKDIAAIKAGDSYSSFGIKKDGTVVTTGIVKLGNVIRDEWTNIKLPADRDALLSQIHLDYIT